MWIGRKQRSDFDLLCVLYADLLTMEASSESLSLPRSVSLSLAHASRPRRMGVSNRRLNSLVVPVVRVSGKRGVKGGGGGGGGAWVNKSGHTGTR